MSRAGERWAPLEMGVEGEEVREIKEAAGAASGVGFAAVRLSFSARTRAAPGV